MTYRRITREDRLQIKAYLDAGLSDSVIADKLGFHRTSISREINRNTGGRGYRPSQAQHKAEERQSWRKKPRKLTDKMRSRVTVLLKKRWSPEQISNRILLESGATVSHETIYQMAYDDYKNGGSLYENLRFSHRKRKPRFPRKSKDRRGVIQNAKSIEERGAGANNRSRVGHWERDLMLGANRTTSVLVFVDRKNRYVRLGKLDKKTADLTLEKSLELMQDMEVKSITNDRGLEFAEHTELSNQLGVPVYFCHPYTSSERGSVENRIGVLRQYLPKGTCLKNLTDKKLMEIEDQINSRPMRCLDWKTPYEVTFGCSVALTT